jgi:hypothetical protein
MEAIHKVIRPTQAVRRLMAAHGANHWPIYTNKYETCRTVKCYQSHIALDAFLHDLGELFDTLGYGVPQVNYTESYSDFRDTRAVIVRIPFALQA